MKNKKIFYILFPSFCVLGLLGLFVISVIINESFKNYFYEKSWSDLESIAYVASKQIESSYSKEQNYDTNSLLTILGKKTKTRFTLVNIDRDVVADSDFHPELVVDAKGKTEFLEAFKGSVGKDKRFNSHEMDEETRLYVALPINVEGQIVAALRSSRADSEIQMEIAKFTRKIIIAAIVLAFLMALVSLFLSRYLSSPMEYMRNQALKISEGELETRIQLKGAVPSELNELALGINTIAIELSKRLQIISTKKQEQDAIFSSMREGVLAVGSNSEILHFNKAAAEILSLTEDDYPTNSSAKNPTKSISEFIIQPEFKSFIEESLEKKLPFSKEVKIIKDLDEKIIQLQSSPILTESSAGLGTVVVFSDVTRMKELEAHRQEFVANVSHELRTPLTSIRGFAETLMEPSVSEEDRLRFLNIIHRHTTRLGDVIEDLLALSRLENTNESRELQFDSQYIYPLIAAAKEICDIKAQDSNISINIDANREVDAVVNGSLLERAIVNLIDNAIKYSDQGSKIDVALAENENEIILSVKDNGPGIAKEHLSRLFERFYRIDKGRDRAIGGTGLGLAIVKHVAIMHQGDVEVDSEMGKGSVFSVVIPKQNS